MKVSVSPELQGFVAKHKEFEDKFFAASTFEEKQVVCDHYKTIKEASHVVREEIQESSGLLIAEIRKHEATLTALKQQLQAIRSVCDHEFHEAECIFCGVEPPLFD